MGQRHAHRYHIQCRDQSSKGLIEGALEDRGCGTQPGHRVALQVARREGFLELKAPCQVLKDDHELALYVA